MYDVSQPIDFFHSHRLDTAARFSNSQRVKELLGKYLTTATVPGVFICVPECILGRTMQSLRNPNRILIQNSQVLTVISHVIDPLAFHTPFSVCLPLQTYRVAGACGWPVCLGDVCFKKRL